MFNSKIRTYPHCGFKFDLAWFVFEAFFIECISTQYVFDPASIKPFIAAHLLRSRSLNASVLKQSIVTSTEANRGSSLAHLSG